MTESSFSPALSARTARTIPSSFETDARLPSVTREDGRLLRRKAHLRATLRQVPARPKSRRSAPAKSVGLAMLCVDEIGRWRFPLSIGLQFSFAHLQFLAALAQRIPMLDQKIWQ